MFKCLQQSNITVYTCNEQNMHHKNIKRVNTEGNIQKRIHHEQQHAPTQKLRCTEIIQKCTKQHECNHTYETIQIKDICDKKMKHIFTRS